MESVLCYMMCFVSAVVVQIYGPMELRKNMCIHRQYSEFLHKWLTSVTRRGQ